MISFPYLPISTTIMGPFSIQCFKCCKGDGGGRGGEVDEAVDQVGEGLARGGTSRRD